MCGIVGIVRKDFFSSKDILQSLKRLEYRGYDSYGIATNTGTLNKYLGEIKTTKYNECTLAIGHCRWATHGKVTKNNTHPHIDCKNEIFIVHNGIIENYAELKENLQNDGHKFSSDTDSEIIAHYFENSQDMHQSIRNFFSKVQGTFAIILFKKDENVMYAFRRDSPLVLGILSDGFIVASDVYALSNKTNTALFFDNDEYAVIDADKYAFFNVEGGVKKTPVEFEFVSDETGKIYDHYMLKEIYDEPVAAERLLHSLKTFQNKKIHKVCEMVKSAKKIVFIASGTSYYASLLGAYFLNRVGVDAQALIASEAQDFLKLDKDTLVIAISQSGETMDVIDVLKSVNKDSKIVSIVNTPYSTIQRMSDISVEILAGQEICVAATKTFVNQIIALLSIAHILGFHCNLEHIPENIKRLFKCEKKIKQIAKELKTEDDIYIIGRGIMYPVAREIALKLKEIAYIHAEGMMGGELKHGTLALINKDMPVISLIDGNKEIMSNTKEVEARGAKIIMITNKKSDIKERLMIDSHNDADFAILATITGQLLAYHIARENNLPIDKPRNLAKCCTVK